MAVAEVHPSAEELTAFTLGTLDDETQAFIEDHVATCTSCQERAATAPGDSFVELVRSVRARTSQEAETFLDPAAQVQTPGPLPALAETEGLAPAVASAGPAEPGCPMAPDAIPPELARHERYRVVRLLGVGGMGAVYEAEHRVMRRRVAVKVIKRDYTANPDALKRFRREVENAARLSHPNIVTTYDAEDAGATQFLVMEYVEGTDLGRLVLQRGPLPVDRACDYVRQAALGLQYAFEQGKGMVHRDLKPHNLMLTPDGRVKILDFGLALFASEAVSAAGVTSTGLVLGTLDYIAPEQADRAHQADIRSDIYSLGCTLYHLLAGQPPFPTGTPLQKVMAHREENPQPLTELRPDLPEGLMPVLERMMAKNPKHRYQTAAEVASALQPFIVPPPPRPRRTHTYRLMVATAILAFLVAGLLGVGVYRIATDKGELVITTESDDVKVVITQGGQLVDVIDMKTDKQIRLALRSGEYELELEGAPKGLKLDIEKATLTRGKETLAKITRKGQPALTGKPPDGLVAWWRADGNAKDSAGANHGTLKGGVEFAPGISGQSFDFDGRSGSVVVPDSPLLDFTSEFTLEAWINPSALVTGYAAIISKEGGSTGQSGYQLLLAPHNSGVVLQFNSPGQAWPGYNFGTSSKPVPINQWTYVVATYDQSAMRIYLNGQLVGFNVIGPAPIARSAANLCISGDDNNNCYFAGRIDEAAVYSRALRPAEVKARWSALAPAIKPVAEKVGEVHRFEAAPGLCGIAISPDGRYLLSTGTSIQLWDLHDRKYVRSFPFPPGPTDGRVHAVSFSPDGSQFLSCSNGGTIRRWDLKTGEQLGPPLRDLAVTDIVYSPDGQKALSSCYNTADANSHAVRLWDVQGWRELRRFTGHTASVQRVAISPDGHRGLSAGHDGSVRLWDLDTGNQLRAIEGTAAAVAFSPDGLLALSGVGDNTMRLWEVETGKEVRRFHGHEDRVFGIAFSPDGRRALSGSADKTVRLWDVATGRELHCFLGNQAPVYSVLFTPDGRYGVSSGEAVRMWRLPDPPPAEEVGEVRRFEGHAGDVWHVALSADGRLALSVGADQTARLWKVATGEQLYCFEGLREDNLGVAFSPDSRTAFCSSGGEVRSWDVATGKERAPLRSQPDCGRIRSLALSHDGRKLLAAGIHAAVLFDLQTGKELQRLDKSDWIHCGALSPDATQILTGADAPRPGGIPLMRLWDAKTGQEIRRFAGHTKSIGDVAFSPDGKLCVSGSDDHNLRVFEVASGKELLSIPHPPSGLRRGAFLPDGQRFLSSCLDGVVRMWDVRDGQNLHSFQGHTGGVYAVAVSSDGRYALSCSIDKTLRLWRLPDPPPAKENP